MKYLILILLFFLPFKSFALAKLDFLQVRDGMLIFSTSASKTAAAPDCAAMATHSYWAMPLDSVEGRSAHILLISALSANISVEVTTAGDCEGTDGYERALNVSLATD